MEQDLAQQIHESANAAWNHVWAAAHVPDEPGELSAPLDGVVEHANERYEQTVRDQCAQAGVNERDFWLAHPEQAVIFRPACVADQLEQIAADLIAESRRLDEEFFRTNPPF